MNMKVWTCPDFEEVSLWLRNQLLRTRGNLTLVALQAAWDGSRRRRSPMELRLPAVRPCPAMAGARVAAVTNTSSRLV